MPVQVPTIDKRDRIPFEAIQDVVDQLAAKFQPDRIILFGSYARGNPRPDSDVDLLVVMPFDGTSLRKSIEILKGIDYQFNLDLIARTPEELEKRIKWRDYFILDIVEKGIVLYEYDSRGVDQ